MKRRSFLAGTANLLAAAPSALAHPLGEDIESRMIFTTSSVSEMQGPSPVHPNARAFVEPLRALGYVEGRNLVLERQSAEGRFERFRAIVDEQLIRAMLAA